MISKLNRNRNTFDNRLFNLIPSTDAENAANRSKAKNTTSNYYGVSFTENGRWLSCVTIHGVKHQYKYILETHAAYHHDLIIKEANMDYIYPLNNIEEPIDFIRKIHQIN